jgi:hypothetical protein
MLMDSMMQSEDIQKLKHVFMRTDTLLIFIAINDLYGEKAMRNVFRNTLDALMMEKSKKGDCYE